MSAGIEIQSGTGYRSASRDPQPLPIVRAICTDRDGNRVQLDMLPARARRIGLDLIGAASAATAEVAIRAWARERGQDGDSIIAWMKIGLDELLEAEGEAEAPQRPRTGGDDSITA